MQRNRLQSALAEINSRSSMMSAGNKKAVAFEHRGAQPVVPGATPNIDDQRLAEALLARGRVGANRVRADGFDAKTPISPSTAPKSGFGQMVSRLMERHASKAGYSAAALLAASQSAQSSSAGGPATTLSGSATGVAPSPVPAPLAAATFDPTLVMLVNRVTGGFSDAEYQLASSLGFSAYLDYHLDYLNIPDAANDAFLAADPSVIFFNPGEPGFMQRVATYNAEDLFFTQDNMGNFYVQGTWIPLLQSTNLYRGCLTTRRLHDRMSEFWTDHFNIDIRLQLQGIMKPVDDREVIRANALGKFPDLLSASVHSPAMLNYLDQALSSFTFPNENYARELLELHTLGEGNGYDETDVVKVAQILTGWSIDPSFGAGQLLTYKYDMSLHDPAAQATTVLPNDAVPINIPAGQEAQGDALIAQLGIHPRTAAYIAFKLCRWMLADSPDPAVVSAVTSVFLSTGGDIKRMLKTILTPTNLNALLNTTPTTLRLKRPKQLACWAYNVLLSGPFWDPANIINPLSALTQRLESMGNAPYLWGPPNGYPDAEGAWIGDLLGRWDLIDSILRNEFEGMNVPYGFLLGILGTFTVDTMGQRMNEILAGGTMTTDEVFWIQQYVDLTGILFNLGGITVQTAVREIYAIAMSTPTCQYY